MATGEELLKAFSIGEEQEVKTTRASQDVAQVSAPVGYSMKTTYEEPSEASGPGYATASKAQADTPKLPGQVWDKNGTTLYNPLRSDPKVEAVLGEFRYHEKEREDTPDAMRLKLKQMEAKLAQFTELLAGKMELAQDEQDYPAESTGPIVNDPDDIPGAGPQADPDSKSKYVRPSRRR